MERLKVYLTELGFTREYRDPMYQLFIQKMYEARSLPLSQLLTPEQLEQQEQLAQQIARAMVIEGRMNDMATLAQSLEAGQKG